jgi:menaquinone-dependent protoporphyrinogen oxidase
LTEWIKSHVQSLVGKPTAFFSVSLSASRRPEEEKYESAMEAVHSVIVQDLIVATGWQPNLYGGFGGAVMNSHYGFAKKLLIKAICKIEGMQTDMSKDYELTNWESVDHFVDDLLGGHQGWWNDMDS